MAKRARCPDCAYATKNLYVERDNARRKVHGYVWCDRCEHPLEAPDEPGAEATRLAAA